MADSILQQRNVSGVVAHHARARPEALALTGKGRSWTYGQLAAQADRIAGAMAGMCPEPGARVA